jgi:hypothetical protein
MRAHRAFTAALLALAALVATPARADTLPTFALVLRDGRITPAQIEVPAGTRIKLTLRNEGSQPCELENLDLRVEKVLAPGASSFVVIHSLAPGRYRFIDEFHPDAGQLELIAR